LRGTKGEELKKKNKNKNLPLTPSERGNRKKSLSLRGTKGEELKREKNK